MISLHGRPIQPPKNGEKYEVGIYRRVSIAEERTGGHTLDTQLARACEQFDRLYGPGCWNLTVFEDDGVSGRYGTRATRSTKKIRKGLVAAAQALDTGKFDDFAVYNLSRLARDNVITEEFLKENVVANGTHFHSVTEDIDLTTSQGWLHVRLITAVNANQRETIAERNQDAAAMRLENGYYMGQVGYGWQWEPFQSAPISATPEIGSDLSGSVPISPGGAGRKPSVGRRRILPIPELGKWIVWMKDRYLVGWSPTKMAGELNALGVPPPEAYKGRYGAYQDAPASGKWNKDVLMHILLRPTHAGLIQTKNGTLIEAEFYEHRYFDPEVREQILATKESRKKFPTNTNRVGNIHLLNGLIVCARCGKRLYPANQSGGKVSFYRCFGGHSHGERTCPNIGAKEEALDIALVAELTGLAQNEQMQQLLLEEASTLADAEDVHLEAEVVQLKVRLRDLDGQFLKWAEMATRGSLTPAQFEVFNRKLTADQTETTQRLEIAETALAGRTQREATAAQVRSLLLDFPAIWGTLDFTERRELLTLLVERLALDKMEDGKTALLTVKLKLLPERTFALVQPVADRKRKFTTGVAALTPGQMALLYWIDQGKSLAEAATEMHVTVGCLRCQLGFIRKSLGIRKIEECAAKARPRLYAERSQLPLAGFANPQAMAEGNIYLSPTLMEVLPLYASGAQTKEIAGMLKLPETTIGGRRTRLLQTLHVKTIYEAVQKARQAGLLEPGHG